MEIFFLTNFKSYPESTGKNAVDLAKIHERVSKETGVKIGVAVNVLDLSTICKTVNIPVFAQYISPRNVPNSTGSVVANLVKSIGVSGTILNHSELRLPQSVLEESFTNAKQNNLETVICAENVDEVHQIAEHFKPQFIAFEPPELIGSQFGSVASQKPDSISDSTKAAGDIPLFVGAGISSAEDIQVSLTLGARGFLVATSICKAPDPYKKLTELAQAIKAYSQEGPQ